MEPITPEKLKCSAFILNIYICHKSKKLMASWTQTDLDAINKAIAQGAKEVWYGDQRVVYNSLSEMLRARDLIMYDLGLTKTLNRGRKFGSFSKGLCRG